MSVRPKKHLGQHFLKDHGIAQRIAQSLTLHQGATTVLEVGPGTGVLSQFLIGDPRFRLCMVEVDEESVAYLRSHYPGAAQQVVSGDFLQLDLAEVWGTGPVAVVGNLPYNIGSQILFRVLEHRQQVTEVVCMLQREVAQRLASGPGTKDYGILSVLLQAFYSIEYLFTVSETVFYPPPKVKSGVIRCLRNDVVALPCSEKLFFQVVKAGFNQRRKTLRNALKSLNMPVAMQQDAVFDKRAEQLSVADFVILCQRIEAERELCK